MENYSSWLDELKLKASIGQQGNDNIGSWAYTDMYTLTATNETTMSPTFWRIGNPTSLGKRLRISMSVWNLVYGKVGWLVM